MDPQYNWIFLIGLIKTKSDFIVRSFETGLERWTLVVAVINFNAYFFGFISDLITHRLEVWKYIFSGSTVSPGLRARKLKKSAGKNTGLVLVPCSHIEVRSYSYFRWCGYFWGPWASSVTTDKFSVRVTKITSKIGVTRARSIPFYF